MFGACSPATGGVDCEVATEASVRTVGRKREAVVAERSAVRERREADMAGCGFRRTVI